LKISIAAAWAVSFYAARELGLGGRLSALFDWKSPSLPVSLFPKLVSADVADAATFANLLPGSSCSELHHGSTNSSYLQSDINVAAPEHRGQSSKVRFRPRIVRFETNLFDAPVLPDCTAPDKPTKIRFRTNAVRFRANVFAAHRLFLNQVESAARPDRAEGNSR
jgi:hypothetical protein